VVGLGHVLSDFGTRDMLGVGKESVVFADECVDLGIAVL
jgi:hypothetical protein